MPRKLFALMITAVVTAAALTVWLLTAAGPTPLIIALPVFMVASVALYRLRK